MKVTRFFHIRPNLNNGGATVRVTGDTEQVGQVDVQVAFCHTFSQSDLKRKAKERKGDHFSKARGRLEAEQAQVKIVPLRYLPQELGRIFDDACKRSKVRLVNPYAAPDYTFAMKYFLPKE
jgi:hypothetical protein